MANGNPLAMFEVLADDQAALIAFYSAVFGWEVDYGAAGFAYVRFPPATRYLLGAIGAAQQGVPGWEKGTAFYLQVPDLSATLEQVVAHGGRSSSSPRRSTPTASPCSPTPSRI